MTEELQFDEYFYVSELDMKYITDKCTNVRGVPREIVTEPGFYARCKYVWQKVDLPDLTDDNLSLLATELFKMSFVTVTDDDITTPNTLTAVYTLATHAINDLLLLRKFVKDRLGVEESELPKSEYKEAL